MTDKSVVEKAAAAYEAIRESSRRRAFEKSVEAFVRVLAGVPEVAPADVSDADLGLLRTLGEGAIERIEERVATGEDPDPDKLQLVEGVYDIRRALEEIDQWRRHHPKG